MEKLLNELVKRLGETYTADLVSVVLYGSAAAGDQQTKFSDLNVICVLKQVGVPELRKAGKTIQWWILQRQPPPLLISAEGARNSYDVFPMEFLDIQQSHRVLYGEDLFTAVNVDRAAHRRQVEYELRSGVLRLRQRYLAAETDDKEVLQLMAKSLPSFATLARHTLILSRGAAPARKNDIFHAAAEQFGLDSTPFQAVLAIRDGSDKPKGEAVHSLFGAYLDQVACLAEIADRIA